MTERAIFLDRDGTLVLPRHYPSRPEQLRVVPNIGAGLRLLQRARFRLIVITNQSGLARGLFRQDDLARMHTKLERDLAKLGVSIDAIYYCPHHPEGVVPELAVHCSCRKPRPGMLLRAATDHDLDLSRSWFVGDILDDVEAGNRAGVRTVLVDLGTEPRPHGPLRRPTYVARTTVHALAIVGAVEDLGVVADLGYQPAAWRSGGVAHAGG